MLPPSIFPHTPVDTMNQRYLNFSNAPIPSPLKRPLKVELYNDQYFPENSKHITNPYHNKKSCAINNSTFLPHETTPYMSTASSLFEDSKVNSSFVEPSDTNAPSFLLPPDITLDKKYFLFSLLQLKLCAGDGI